MIYKLVAKLRATGVLLNRRKTQLTHVHTEDKLDEISACLEYSLRKSISLYISNHIILYMFTVFRTFVVTQILCADVFNDMNK